MAKKITQKERQKRILGELRQNPTKQFSAVELFALLRDYVNSRNYINLLLKKLWEEGLIYRTKRERKPNECNRFTKWLYQYRAIPHATSERKSP